MAKKAERRETGGRESPEAKRLRLIRLAEMKGTDNKSAWAQRMGFTITQLSNYENGVPISKNAAIQMSDRVPGLTTDYILKGGENGMSVDLRERLREAERFEKGIRKGRAK